MQLSIEAIVFHRDDDGVEAQKFNLLDRARFNTIPQLREPCERRLGRFKIARKLRSSPTFATCKKRSPPSPLLSPSRRGEQTPPEHDRPVELFNAVARYRRRMSPCTSFNRTPHFSRRRITVSRSPFCYATTALIHYSCAAETRLAT